MTKVRVLVGLTIVLTLVGWVTLRPGPRSAVVNFPTAYDPFTEDNATHRYATSQTRHWRQMVTHRQ